jgi:hypothetical protein
VFRCLGVFVDGFDIEALSAVAGLSRQAATNAAEALVTKSMVARVSGVDRTRFGLLETVKAYAEDRLDAAGGTAEAHDRHLRYFHGLATKRGCSGFSELRLGVDLRRDRSNLTAAFERAAEDKRWIEAGELITGSYAAFLLDGGALDVIALIERARQGCRQEDAGLSDALKVALGHCLVWLNEWTTLGRIADSLMGSAVPPLRAWGFIIAALVTGFSDVDAARVALRRAEADVETVLRTNPSLTADVVAGYVPWIRARISATAGDYASALHDTEAWLDVQAATDFYSTGATRAVKHAAVCQLLIGETDSAARTIERLDQFDFIGSNTDDVHALRYLALGEIALAEGHIRTHAARALTGRLIGEACDSALLLAALATAEGDIDLGRDLLLHMGMGQEPATIVYSSHLAAQLGITDQHAEGQRCAMGYNTKSPEGPSGSRIALEAVRNAVRRRGWL